MFVFRCSVPGICYFKINISATYFDPVYVYLVHLLSVLIAHHIYVEIRDIIECVSHLRRTVGGGCLVCVLRITSRIFSAPTTSARTDSSIL